MWVNILGTNHTKPLVLFACGTNNSVSVIIILATIYGGLTVCQMYKLLYLCLSLGVVTIAVLILPMRNLKLGEVQ